MIDAIMPLGVSCDNTTGDFLGRLEHAWRTPNPEQKVIFTEQLWQDWQAGAWASAVDANGCFLTQTDLPMPLPTEARGSPEKPILVSPLKVEKRSLQTPIGRAALLHAITHIEFNAINIALDAVYRFRGLPVAYYHDWLQVAAEEANHFALLNAYLQELGYAYGDLTAHSGLWDMVTQTAHSVLVRMALVPRVLEARGLDVTPGICAKFAAQGDNRAVEILSVIESEEIGHVAIGNRWYAWCCAQAGLPPLTTFERLMQDYNAPKIRPPLALASRAQAGFSPEELAWLSQQVSA